MLCRNHCLPPDYLSYLLHYSRRFSHVLRVSRDATSGADTKALEMHCKTIHLQLWKRIVNRVAGSQPASSNTYAFTNRACRNRQDLKFI